MEEKTEREGGRERERIQNVDSITHEFFLVTMHIDLDRAPVSTSTIEKSLLSSTEHC